VAAALHELTLAQIQAAVAALHQRGQIEFLRSGTMPEADVFLCRSGGRRFNVKFDLAYGAQLDAVDAFSRQELAELEQALTDTAA